MVHYKKASIRIMIRLSLKQETNRRRIRSGDIRNE